MRSIFSIAALVLALAGLTGCGGSTTIKPAELGELKPSVDLETGWVAAVGRSGVYTFSPDTDGQSVYAASANGTLARLDLATGQDLWRIQAEGQVSAGVGVGEGLAVLGTRHGDLLAYRTDNGQLAWTARLGGEILAAPVAGHGYVAARGNDGRIGLFEAATGKPRWITERSLPALVLRDPSALIITDQAVIVGHPGGKLTALSLVNGAPLWESNLALPRGTSELERIADVTGALASDGGVVCAAAFQGRIGCIDQQTGQPVWSREFSGLRGVEMDGRNLYAIDEHAAVQAFDKSRGSSPWKQEAFRDRSLSTPLALERYLAVADFEGYLHLLSLEDGSIVGRIASDGSAIRGRMLRLASGVLMQTANGGVYAFRLR